MEGGSVRDRIRAAEIARQQQEGGPVSPSSARRNFKIDLKQDEHVKEEFLKKGDGGWTKKVNVGQMASFALPKTVPAIQVTQPETPVIAKVQKQTELPGRINVPGAFEASDDPDIRPPPTRRPRPTIVSESSNTVSKASTKAKKSSILQTEDLLSADIPTPRRKPVGNRKSVDFEVESESELKPPVKSPKGSRDSVTPTPLKQKEQKTGRAAKSTAKAPPELKKEKKKSTENSPKRSPRPVSKREERLSAHYTEDDLGEAPRRKSRSASRHMDEQDHEDRDAQKPRARRKSSHQSPKLSPEEPPDATDNSRRRSSLWPSFSHSQRRSISDLIEGVPIPRPKAGHNRSYSADNASVAPSEKPPASPRKELGFMEYISGKKLDHIPEPALKQKPAQPMGYVRSRNSTGDYSEHFTRNKRYLRKPDEDEFLEYETSDRERRRRHSSWNDVVGQRKEEPWQVKFARELARR